MHHVQLHFQTIEKKLHCCTALHAVYHLELKFVNLIARYQNPPSEFRGKNF